MFRCLRLLICTYHLLLSACLGLIIDPLIDFTLTKPPCPPQFPPSHSLNRGFFFKTLQDMAANMQKVKSQHLAICWAIDVSQS